MLEIYPGDPAPGMVGGCLVGSLQDLVEHCQRHHLDHQVMERAVVVTDPAGHKLLMTEPGTQRHH